MACRLFPLVLKQGQGKPPSRLFTCQRHQSFRAIMCLPFIMVCFYIKKRPACQLL